MDILWAFFHRALPGFVVIVAAYLVFRATIGWWYRRAAARTLHREGKRCICGYDLTGLAVPRCPECGRAVGFDKTFEELGVAPEELRPRSRPPST